MSETPKVPSVVFDLHDSFAGHVTLTEDDDYFFLYVGHRDLQFSKKDGKCVGRGTTLGGPCSRYCMKCQSDDTEEPPPDRIQGPEPRP